MRSRYFYILGGFVILLILAAAGYFAYGAWQNAMRDQELQNALAKGDITLYLYDIARDTAADGTRNCSDDALVPVTRSVGAEKANINYALALTLAGDITEAERAQGLSPIFLLDYFDLTGGNFNDGVLTLRFNPIPETTPDPCVVKLARAQIEKTLAAYPSIKRIDFEPAYLF